MEENQTLFTLSIEPVTKTHLSEAARWARFIAVAGFIFIGIVVVCLVLGGAYLSTYFTKFTRIYGSDVSYNAGITAGIIAYYLLYMVVIFFAYLFLFRFGVRMKTALNGNSQDMLNSSFQNLKILLRYIGILLIIVIVFALLGLIIAVIAGSAFRA